MKQHGRLQAGDKAWDFQVTDILNRQISLEKFRGRKLMLSFYRYASCPLCNLRVAQLINEYPDYHKRGLSMVAFFQSSRESILHYIGRQDAPFTIVADPERSIYRLYGVESSWSGYARSLVDLPRWFDAIVRHGFKPGKMEGDKALIPADFLVGPDLIIRQAFYGKDIGDHIPLPEIDSFLG